MRTYIFTVLFCFALFPVITFAKSKDDCFIVYGLRENYKPYEWVDENGTPRGMNVDLLKATASRAGCGYKIVTYKWKEILDLLKKGEITMISSSLTPDRGAYLVQLPHSMVLYRYFFNRIDSPYINDLEDLRGKTVLILAGGAGGEFISSVSKQYDLKIKQYSDHANMIKALSLNEGDAVISSLVGVMNVLEDMPYPNIRITGYPFLSSVFGFLLNKKDTELYRTLDISMTELKTDGTYFEILKKWSVNDGSKYEWYKYASLATGIFSVIFLIIILWNKALQRQVKKKSESLNEEINFRKMKERELILSNSQYQRLSELLGMVLDATPECIYLINKRGEVAWSNMKVGARGVNLDIIKKEIDKAAIEKKPFEIKQISDGNKVWQISASIIEQGEHPILLVAADITENVRLLDEALMSERLAAIGEMAASVAHEINNPTGIIIHNISFIEELNTKTASYIDENLTVSAGATFCGFTWSQAKEESSNSITIIKESLTRIKNTIEDLKDFGKARDSFYEPRDIRDCLATAVKLSTYFVKQYTNNFSVKYSEDFIPILGNRLHIEQVMINIIHNACYSLKDKAGTVECSVYPLKDRDFMVFSVCDNGCGIPANILDDVCKPFYSTRKNSGGTGLGLAIASRVMKEHNGRIEIQSEVGRGTLVKLYFPANAEDNKE